MNLPDEAIIRQGIDPKLAVGSSLPKPKELLAWVITLFFVNDEKSLLEYSESIEGNKIRIEQTIFDRVKRFFSSLEDYNEDFFNQYQSGDSNPLCYMQLEPLQVPLQLVWKLAKINAIDSTSSSIERSGGVRVPKVLNYTTNLLLIKNILSTDDSYISECAKKVLYSWIVDSEVNSSCSYVQDKLISTLLVFSEDTIYKVWDEGKNEVIFQQEGIYSKLRNESDTVNIKGTKEIKGTLRNLKSFLKKDLHSYLKIDSDDISIRSDSIIREYINYTSLVSNFLDLVPRSLLQSEVIQTSAESQNNIKNKQANTIYYGAPGTGKSHTVKKLLKSVSSEKKETITFHPDYDYVSFVGGYRPISEKDDNGDESIKYKFVPQVFTNIYVNAWKNPQEPFYLVIEEINRGNCAEIFGDIFQLLDQNQDYTVTPSSELNTYLVNELSKSHEGIIDGLKMPPNLSILATMNTSDQSLFPMDSAFKRRWDWEYIPINYDRNDENASSKFMVEINDEISFSWLDFIEKVNTKIKSNPNLGMDKCIGNYFIKPKDNTISLKTFINKAIFYLWNDVFKDEFGSDSIFAENVTYEDFFPIEENGAQRVKELLVTLDVELLDKTDMVSNEDTN